MRTLLKQERNEVENSPKSCNKKVKLQLSSFLSLTISFPLSFDFIHFNSKLFRCYYCNLLQQKKFETFVLYFHTFYCCILYFTFYSSLTLLTLLYLCFLHTFNYEDSFFYLNLTKYLQNRNNYSFHLRLRHACWNVNVSSLSPYN